MPQSKRYRIPAERCRIEMTVVNSRFIATADFAATVEEAKNILYGVRAEMPDASHHVHAFRVGYGNSVTESMSDDGEPSGTAGPPVLAVVRGSNIGDIIVVVTRYFGGTKLGTGGLVRSYGDAAREVLKALKTEEKIEKSILGIECPYSLYEQIKRLITRHNGVVNEETFAADVTVMATFPLDDIEAFSKDVIELSAGRVAPIVLGDA